MRSGAIDVLVIDSVAALTPRAEIEGEMGDSQPGLQARLMSQALRKLTASISRSNTMVIFINQIRMKIGVMYGSPETTTGGNALKFYASVRLDIRRIGAIKDREEVVGNQTRVKVVKNKVAPPFKQVEFDIMYGEGVSKSGELIDLGVKAGVVEKSGRVVLLRQPAPRPGPRERQGLSESQSRGRRPHRGGDPRERRPDRRAHSRQRRSHGSRRRRSLSRPCGARASPSLKRVPPPQGVQAQAVAWAKRAAASIPPPGRRGRVAFLRNLRPGVRIDWLCACVLAQRRRQPRDWPASQSHPRIDERRATPAHADGVNASRPQRQNWAASRVCLCRVML